jgi:hypothetical protein
MRFFPELVVGIDSALRHLHCVDTGSIAYISGLYDAHIFSVEVGRAHVHKRFVPTCPRAEGLGLL